MGFIKKLNNCNQKLNLFDIVIKILYVYLKAALTILKNCSFALIIDVLSFNSLLNFYFILENDTRDLRDIKNSWETKDLGNIKGDYSFIRTSKTFLLS